MENQSSNAETLQKAKLSQMASISFISGILSWAILWLLVAWIVYELDKTEISIPVFVFALFTLITTLIPIIAGHNAFREIRNSRNMLRGKWLASFGLIWGYLGLLFWTYNWWLVFYDVVYLAKQ